LSSSALRRLCSRKKYIDILRTRPVLAQRGTHPVAAQAQKPKKHAGGVRTRLAPGVVWKEVYTEGPICMRFVILGFSSLRTLIDAWHVRLLHESLEIMLHKIGQFSGTHNPSVRTRTGASGAYGPWGCRRVGSRSSDGAFDCQLTSFFFIWREILPNLSSHSENTVPRGFTVSDTNFGRSN
jgi:hypothetical protein